MSTVITVTAEHIAAGKREDCEHCPIALAVAEVFPGSPYVDEFACIITAGDGSETEFDLPDEARAFVEAFDNGQPAAPFTFTAELLALVEAAA